MKKITLAEAMVVRNRFMACFPEAVLGDIITHEELLEAGYTEKSIPQLLGEATFPPVLLPLIQVRKEDADQPRQYVYYSY